MCRQICLYHYEICAKKIGVSLRTLYRTVYFESLWSQCILPKLTIVSLKNQSFKFIPGDWQKQSNSFKNCHFLSVKSSSKKYFLLCSNFLFLHSLCFIRNRSPQRLVHTFQNQVIPISFHICIAILFFSLRKQNLCYYENIQNI